MTDMLEALTRAVASLQRDDRAADRLGDLPRAAAREVSEMAALAALVAQAGIGSAELGALRDKLIPVAALELLLPAGCGGDRLGQTLLVPRAALDRALHGLTEIVSLLREGEKAFAITVERSRLDPRAARDDGDHLDVLEQRLEQRGRLRGALADRREQGALGRQCLRQLAQPRGDLLQRGRGPLDLGARQFLGERRKTLVQFLEDDMAANELVTNARENILNARRDDLDRRNRLREHAGRNGGHCDQPATAACPA